MTTLTEQTAVALIAARSFDAGPPGFVGAAVELLLDRPGLPASLVESLGERPPLRHGFLTARSPWVMVVSGPPSPGLEACLARMGDDLPMPLPLIGGHGLAVLDVAAAPGGTPATATTPRDDTAEPDGTAGTERPGTAGTAAAGRIGPGESAAAGIRVGLEAGLDCGGPLGLARRWRLAHTLGPVLAAAFANAPAGGWRSVRQAQRRDLPVVPPGAGPQEAWARLVLDAPDRGRPFRERIRAGAATWTDLDRHMAGLRPPVAARGHLEVDVADRQPGAHWRIPIAVAVALLDDPKAADAATTATDRLAAEPRLWERAARDALTDPVLATAARDCFLAAYAALARQGAGRHLRDAVAAFTERYVLRGRCPADDLLDRTAASR